MTKIAISRDDPTPKLDLRGTFLRRTDLSHASLRKANLSEADFSHAVFRGADFKDAILERTILRGADLTGARNLTTTQLSSAILDETTKLPDYISREDVVGRAAGTRR